MPAFIHKFGSTHPDGTKYIGTGLQQGMFLTMDAGSLLALAIIWYIYDYVGRIRVLQGGLIATFCGIVLATWAPNPATFLIARVFSGISLGCVHSGAFLWVGESAVAHNVSQCSHTCSDGTCFIAYLDAYPLPSHEQRSMSSAFYSLKTTIGSFTAAMVGR